MKVAEKRVKTATANGESFTRLGVRRRRTPTVSHADLAALYPGWLPYSRFEPSAETEEEDSFGGEPLFI